MSITDLSGALWRKSSHSNGQANCVEVAAVGDGRTVVAVRDSKAPDALGLIFTTQAWRQFTDNIEACRRPVKLRSANYAHRLLRAPSSVHFPSIHDVVRPVSATWKLPPPEANAKM